MATLTVRNLDEETKHRLRIKAAQRGVSLEEEVRSILRREAQQADQSGQFDNLYDAIRSVVEPYGGFEMEIPDRGFAERDPPFKDWK